MKDIRFNPHTRDLNLKDGDFDIADETSTSLQNGFIMAGTEMVTPRFPALGLSLDNSIGGSEPLLLKCIQWANMCKKDGATSANFEIKNDKITLIASYP